MISIKISQRRLIVIGAITAVMVGVCQHEEDTIEKRDNLSSWAALGPGIVNDNARRSPVEVNDQITARGPPQC
jgi:hypothetical protein